MSEDKIRYDKVMLIAVASNMAMKHTMVPLTAAVWFTYDVGAHLTASWNELYVGVC